MGEKDRKTHGRGKKRRRKRKKGKGSSGEVMEAWRRDGKGETRD